MKYFDYASSTPVDPQVLETYHEVLKQYFVNADSLYPEGIKVNSLMNKSRHQVADLLRVKENEILFTSGGSEANNMAIKGIALKHMEKGKHIITSSIEHSSVLNSCRWLEKNLGFEVTYLPVNREGKVDPENVIKAIRNDTVLVSVMMVNNESGSIQPIDEIKKTVRKYPNCYMHVDCVQALGKMPVDLTDIDLASFSAHKIYGLKGSGILMKKQHVQIEPLISGGKQEQHLRGGTENSPSNMLWGKTLRLALADMDKHYITVKDYNEYLRSELLKMDNIVINSPDDALPYVLNFSCLKIQSEVMMNALALKGYCVSAQSTCESGDAVSHVISQMFHEHDRLKGTIRLSLSWRQSEQDMKDLIKDLKEIIEKYG